MSYPTLMHIRRKTVQLLEEAISSWPNDQFDAEMAREVRDALSVCRTWPDELEDVRHSLWRQVKARQLTDFQKAGEMVLELVDQALRTVDQLGRKARAFEQEGQPIRGAEQLGDVQEKLRHFRQQFVDNWLWMDEKILEEARAEYARGEYQTVQEILDELQGRNP